MRERAPACCSSARTILIRTPAQLARRRCGDGGDTSRQIVNRRSKFRAERQMRQAALSIVRFLVIISSGGLARQTASTKHHRRNMSTRRRAPKRKAAEAALEGIMRDAAEEALYDNEDNIVLSNLRHRAEFVRGSVFWVGSVSLPDDISCRVLDFLPKCELVHRASLVSSSWWLLANRSPLLWHALDFENDPKTKEITSLVRFHKLLRRPQFASLKKLVPPCLVRTVQLGLLEQSTCQS